MRRALAALAATVAGLVMLLDFKSSPASSSSGALALPGTSPSAAGSGPSDSAGTSPSAAGSAASSSPATDSPSAAGSSGPATPKQTQTPTATPQATPKATPAPTKTTTATKTATGSSVPVTEGFRTFGSVQVKVTVSGGKITDLVAVNYPHNDPRSYEISQYSIPVLQQEVLAAQGTKIDVVSGATYTSEAYAQSVQAALDALKS
jgi:uncharacterized protein with FMN-binding domain